tara:strand:- start:1980 stop:2378 length:399 start_codon:yes stop_codon:yes gene_type:complete
MKWTKDPKYTNVWVITKKFNGYQYNVIVMPEQTHKSIKYWISVSSGKKRKEFEIFEGKENKSLGGIRALFWIKEAMYDFPKFYKDKHSLFKLNSYICIGWSDSRRRDIYKRLEKEGFQFMMDEGNKILIKKL